MSEKSLGLYVHIPFCKQKCAYCDFYSLPNVAQKEEYLQALCQQIEWEGKGKEDYTVDTVFLGGGTPSILNLSALSHLFETIQKSFTLSQTVEWTMESNPATLSQETLCALRSQGLNRLSIGVQSVHEKELNALGRIHTVAQAKEAVLLAQRAGISNINVDLMFGIPHQTMLSWKKTLQEVLSWNVSHLSLYGLQLEENTLLYRNREILPFPTEDTEAQMYFFAIDFLSEKGFSQYEISNFSKKGMECRHNLKYWRQKSYLGFGPSAHGFFENRRYACQADLHSYLLTCANGSFANLRHWEEIPTPHAVLEEYVMLALRTTYGIDDDAFRKRFSVPFSTLYEKKLPLLLQQGYMKKEGSRYSFTRKGFFVSNTILSDLLDFE